MNELKIFENRKFGEVRTIEEDGIVLFCGSDVAKALGYTNPRKAVSDHCRGVTKRYIGVQTGTRADGTPAMQEVEMLFITEGDIYRLAARSKLPGAEEFERWVFDEVIPSIRRTGAYMMPQDYPSALRALADAEEKKMRLLAENQRQAQIIADFEPVRQYVDTILESPAVLATGQIAADYDLSANRLNKILHEEGVQHKVNGQWILYKKHMGKGYTKSRTTPITHSSGQQDIKLHTYWTQKGRMMIHNILTARGILAVMDRDRAC